MDGRRQSKIVRLMRQGLLQGAVLGRNPVVAYQTERYILLPKVRILAVYPEARLKARNCQSIRDILFRSHSAYFPSGQAAYLCSCFSLESRGRYGELTLGSENLW